jgi:hypothetical protein
MINDDVSGDLKDPRREFMHRSRMQIQLCLQNDILNQIVGSMRIFNAAADKKSQAVSNLVPKDVARIWRFGSGIVIDISFERF